MSARSLSALAAASLLLAGCAFTPLYGDASGSPSLSRISVTTQDDRLGYRLREQLEDALGWNRNAAPLYRLETVRGAWTLTPVSGGAALTGTETVTTTYAAADQPYAAIAAQQDGEDRAAAELARLIRVDLMRALSAP